MGKALFKRWFVDFEFPNENGKPYKSSGGEMVDSELGEMPKGWRVGKLSDIARIVTNSVRPNELTKRVPYVGLEHMPRMSLTLDSYGNNEDVGSSKYLFEKNDILFGKLRPYFHKVVVAPFSGVCSTDILVFQPNEQHLFSYLLYILYGEEFVHLASAATIGTKMPRMSKDFALKYEILIPDDEILEKFNEIVLSCIESIQANTKNMAPCKQLRDSLLPRLMSGKLRVQQKGELYD